MKYCVVSKILKYILGSVRAQNLSRDSPRLTPDLIQIKKVVSIWGTGFPKKDARFLKIQNITNLLSDDK